MTKITKDMRINEIIAIDTSIFAVLMASGMHCAGCPSAQIETLEEACYVHGVDVEELTAKINEHILNLA